MSEKLPPEIEAQFAEAERKFKQWFYDRGYTQSQLMTAEAAYEKYKFIELQRKDNRPFDKAPGFKRIFMMGYFYGKYE